MSQPSIASYFHSRKRAAVDDIFNIKNKVILLDPKGDNSAIVLSKNKIFEADAPPTESIRISTDIKNVNEPKRTASKSFIDDVSTTKKANIDAKTTTTTTTKPSLPTTTSTVQQGILKASKDGGSVANVARPAKQQKIVKFTLAGNLSPRKRKVFKRLAETERERVLANEPKFPEPIGHVTPTKAEQKARLDKLQKDELRKNLPLDAVKSKINRSSRLQDLKASMTNLKALEETRKKIADARNAKLDKHSFNEQQSNRAAMIVGKTLKQFETIDLEVLTRYVFTLNLV